MPDFAMEKVHFVGVGGASMSALAELMLLWGAQVTGSDRVECPAFARLREMGAEVYTGARRDIIARAGIVVFSSAVPESDAELTLARAMKKRVLERHEFLAEIAGCFGRVAAVAGTHGKTTVTAMTAHILRECGVPFVAHIGGIPAGGESGIAVNRAKDGSEAQEGALPLGLFLTEACEFRRHLLSLSPAVAAVTNMECDHPDSYRDIDEVHAVFAEFLKDCPLSVVRAEDSFVCTNAHITITTNEKGAKCGERAKHGERTGRARRRKRDMSACTYKVSRILEWSGGQTVTLLSPCGKGKFTLPVRGAHYAEDGAFAVALAVALGADFHEACAALSGFGGVRRRFERTGRIGKAEAIFDYAHHPTEIECALKSARKQGRTLVVFQPHTYSRTARYMEDFVRVLGETKEVVLLPTYAARERSEAGATSAELAAHIAAKYPKCKVYLATSHDDAWIYAKTRAAHYKVVLFLGAGDIYSLRERTI